LLKPTKLLSIGSWKFGVPDPHKGGLLDPILAPWRFASFAAHQSIESGKICTMPSFCEEHDRIHDRHFSATAVATN
jgi:hypothetical protein